ncbi:MAG: type II secretion system F family protein [Deltaproteobacteria bacterium]|nr:type II secretion system F family protein [Deltaproteobacteria bacterium]
MSSSTFILQIAGTALVLAGIAIFLYAFLSLESAPRTVVGLKGLKRAIAIKEGGWFASVEPMVRFLAARVQGIKFFDRYRPDIDQQVLNAGEILGLSSDEYIALSLLAGVMATGMGMVMFLLVPETFSPVFVIMLGALGLMSVYLQISGMVADRLKQINRGLPYAIDLASLAMGAGLDFPGALRQVTEKAPDKGDALVEELLRIQNELDLGRTRKQALEGFAERAPTDAVKDFVQSVIQSEEKGNPLADVLTIQANTLRMRRSVSAEEGAAKAGVMMIGPLMLIFLCILMILLGPFIVNMASGKGI